MTDEEKLSACEIHVRRKRSFKNGDIEGATKYYNAIACLEEPPDEDNVKAYFKREKLTLRPNGSQARADFEKVLNLDPSLGPAVAKEIRAMEERIREKQKEEKGRYKNLFISSSTSPAATMT
ncbi:hypothetical protein AMELA_G00055960 [Ameiurus melas]|uniref:Uncharacterized protein n=1 Tax=Ameiurus melas TaxID=219545 RepID=A0A7J6B8Q2_AMEME|nr:hypothetical protein AMELA_G00055960 [Ameiurus melas]